MAAATVNVGTPLENATMAPLRISCLLAVCALLHGTVAVGQACRRRELKYGGHAGRKLAGRSFANCSCSSPFLCSALCMARSRCASFNYAKKSATCQLNDATRHDYPANWRKDDGFVYFDGVVTMPNLYASIRKSKVY